MEHLSEVRPHGEGFTMEVPTRIMETYQSGYEPMSRAIFASSSMGCDVVLDIGSGMGFYSLVAQQSNPKAKVIAVEASPENFRALQRNIHRVGLRGSIKALHGVFGRVSVARRWHISEASDNSGLASHPNSETNGFIEVGGVTAESLGINSNSTVLAKIDVEGQEIEVVEELLQLNKIHCDLRLLIDFDPKTMLFAGFKPRDLIDLLLLNSYRMFLIDEENRNFDEITDADSLALQQLGLSHRNIYCLPSKSCVQIAAFLHSNGYGGAEKSHLEFCEDVISLGNMIRTFLPLGENGIAVHLRLVGSSAEDCPMTRDWWAKDHQNPWRPSTLKSFFSPAAIAWARDRDWKNEDVILTQTSVVSTGALVAMIADKPHLWWIHEFGDIDHNLQFPLEIRQMGELFRNLSQQVMTNSNAVRSHFFGNDAEDVAVVGYSSKVPLPTCTPKPTVPHIVLVAALHPGKGGDVFLRGLSQLKDRGVGFTAALRGKGANSQVQNLDALIESLGLRGLVSIEQSLTTYDELYCDASIVVVASRNEAFGRVPFEATAYDCPVVFSNSGGLLEFMVDGSNGLAFGPTDYSELSAKLESIINNPELSRQLVLGAKGTLLAEERRGYNLTQLENIFQPYERPLKLSIIQHLLTLELTERDSLLGERDSLLAERDSLLRSNSWKATKPLRGFSRFLRGERRN